MTGVLKKWMSALLALFILMTIIPASLAEEVAESAAAAEAPEDDSVPKPEAVAVAEPEPAPVPMAVPQPEAVMEAPVEEVPEAEAPAEEVPATDAPVQEAPAETEAAVETPTEAPTPEPVVIAQLQLGDMGNLIYVPYGTLEADLPLYAMLPALYSNGTSGQVSVSWSCVGDSLGGSGYVPNHADPSVVFYFQPTPVGVACDPAMLLPMVTVVYESVPMAVAENPDIEIAGDTITIARGAKVTTDDIVNEPGYDPSFLVRNQGTITGGSAELHNPIHGGTISGGTFYGDVNDAPQYVLRISGGEFYGNIGDHDGEAVDAYVYISGGTFHSDVRARNLVISGGTFGESCGVYLLTVGTISGGTFYGTVINHLGILNGPNSVPEFYGRVVNAQAPYGQIYGGRFYGEVDNSAGGKITDGAEFVRGTINNNGTIDAGSSVFSAEVQIVNEVGGKIVGGTFGCPVYNSGSISGGVYNAPVSNLGMISGGSFYSDMSNEGTIAGADLYGAMTRNTGTISTEGITVDVENGRVIISSGTSVTTDLILAAIDDGDEAGIATIENNGTITGGSAVISCTVDNDNGTISGGIFDGHVTGGKITNGTFNGGVNADGKGIARISGGTFNGNVGAASEGHVFISGGTFCGEVQARNLVISGGTFGANSNVVLSPVGGISGGTFDGTVTSTLSIEGGTFNGKVVNKGTIFGGVFNGGIDNYGEITYISEYTLTQDIVDGKAVSQTFSVTQTYLNCAVNDFGGCIYGPVKYGDGFSSDCVTYVMASITEDDSSVKLYRDKDFRRNGNVLEGLRALDARQNVSSIWTRTGGGEIGESDTFAADAESNQFTRKLNWEIKNGVLELRTNEALSCLPEAGSYKSVHIWAGVTVNDAAWNVPVVNDGTIAGGSFKETENMYETYVTNNASITGGSFDAVTKNNGTISGGTYERNVTNDGTISGGTFNGEVVNNGTIIGAELNSLVRSNANSSIKLTDFGPDARFQETPKGQVEVNYTADGVTYYAAYGTIMYSKLRSLRNEPYMDWYLISKDGSATTVGVSAQLTLSARTFEARKRVTPEIVWPTAGVLPYGEKLSSARLTSTDRYGTFSWKTPNVIPDAGTHSFTVVYKPTYPTTYDYTGVSFEKDITVEVKRNAAVIVLSSGQTKYYGEADPVFGVSVTGLKNGDKLNYTIKRAPGEAIGTYVITAELGNNPNYDVSVHEGKFTIAPKPIPYTIEGSLPNETYTGGPLTPKPAIVVDGVTLVEGTDYTLSYYNNIDAGSNAYVLVQGIGNYCAVRRMNFQIVKASATITANSVTKALGEADPVLTAEVSGAKDGSKLNYALKRAVGEDAGTYAITVALGDNPNYDVETVNGTLTIAQKQLPIASEVAAQVYTGKALTPKPVIMDGSKLLTEDIDYTLSYSGNTNAGTASITITGKGNYTGTQTLRFDIEKADGAVIAVNSVIKALGEADPALTATVTGVEDVSLLNYTLKRAAGENAGAYAITAELGDNANFGNIKVVDGTLTIMPKQLPAPAAVAAQVYTGKALTPKPVIKDGSRALAEGTDYSLAYNNNINAGTASIVITGKGNYTGTQTLNFTIEKMNAVVVAANSVSKALGAADPALTATVTGLPEGTKVNYSLKRAAGENAGTYTISVVLGSNPNLNVQTVSGTLTITPKQLPAVTPVEAQTYTGKAIAPKPVIKDGSKTLTAGTDYTLTYKNNLNAGTASIVATGKGNYTGSRTLNFTINKADAVVTVNAVSKSLGEADPYLTAKVTGALSDQSINYTLKRAKGETVGTYAITVTLGNNPNYNVTVQNGVLTILPDPSSVTLSSEKLSLDVGKSQKLTATLLPKGTTSEITYSTSDKAVATVAADGTVKAVKAGVATITATTANGKTATCQVTVKPIAEKITIGSGEKRTLTVSDASVKIIAYTSSNASIAAVEATGAITAKKAGSATITATANSVEIAKWDITVTEAPSKVTISAEAADMGVGETLKLTARVDAAVNSVISWSSSKTSVATVDGNGVVTAIKAGSAVITAETYNGKKATCKVTVKKAPTSIELSVVTVTIGSGDSVAVKTTLSSGSAGAITYTSTNEKIAALRDGKIIAGSTAGTATITAKTYNGKKATCKVTVLPAPKTISLGKDLTLGVKQSAMLTPVLSSGSKATLTYASSDSSVASVTAAGKVTAKKVGTATITVTAHNGVKASIKVTVQAAPTKVTMSETKASLKVGKTLKLKASLPSGSASDLTWSSGNAGVATVDANGVVTAKKAGTATITVKTYNGKTATCKITVEK